jgi:hypothetical protein
MNVVKRKMWQAETLTEIVFTFLFENAESKVCLGDYFTLQSLEKDIVFYFQLKSTDHPTEPVRLLIPNRYWKCLLDFPHRFRMKKEQQFNSKYWFSSFSDDQARFLIFRKTYPSFWASQHKFFDLEYIHPRFVLMLGYTQIDILKDTLKKLKKKFRDDEQNF